MDVSNDLVLFFFFHSALHLFLRIVEFCGCFEWPGLLFCLLWFYCYYYSFDIVSLDPSCSTVLALNKRKLSGLLLMCP